MKSRANKSIFKVKPYVPGKPIDEVKRELSLKRVIKLASNENPYGPSSKVLQAINKAAKELNRYPAGDCYYLRQLLAKRLNVKVDQLIFGNGSDELIVLAARSFIKPGDEVLIAKPSFLIYDIASKLAGARIKSVALKEFEYDLDAMAKAITRKTRIIFVGNPDNPSGIYITEKQMRRFLKRVPKDVLVFIDEAYFEYVDQKDYVDSIKLLKSYKNVVVSRTFSKMYGLAGLRIGYGIAHRDIIDIFNRIREPFNVNSIAQAAALACLKDKAYYRQVARKIKKQRLYLQKQLTLREIPYEKSFTNFILIKVKKNAKVVVQQLMKKGIIVRDMSHWGLNNYIRISIGTQTENRVLIKQLEAVL